MELTGCHGVSITPCDGQLLAIQQGTKRIRAIYRRFGAGRQIGNGHDSTRR